MKVKFIITAFCMHFLSFSYGQVAALDKTQEYADTFANQLRSSGIDSIIIYTIDPIGCILNEKYTPDSLTSRPTYVFWKNGSKNYFKRFDIYYHYKFEVLDTDTFIDYLAKSIDHVSKENIYNYEKANTNGLLKVLPSHETFYRIKIFTKTDSVVYSIPSTALKKDNYFFDNSVNELLQIKILNYIRQIIRPYNFRKFKKEKY